MDSIEETLYDQRVHHHWLWLQFLWTQGQQPFPYDLVDLKSLHCTRHIEHVDLEGKFSRVRVEAEGHTANCSADSAKPPHYLGNVTGQISESIGNSQHDGTRPSKKTRIIMQLVNCK